MRAPTGATMVGCPAPEYRRQQDVGWQAFTATGGRPVGRLELVCPVSFHRERALVQQIAEATDTDTVVELGGWTSEKTRLPLGGTIGNLLPAEPAVFLRGARAHAEIPGGHSDELLGLRDDPNRASAELLVVPVAPFRHDYSLLSRMV